ncbi:hypothetical protein ABH940_005087 [Streptacidiphilus sp. BW17]
MPDRNTPGCRNLLTCMDAVFGTHNIGPRFA